MKEWSGLYAACAKQVSVHSMLVTRSSGWVWFSKANIWFGIGGFNITGRQDALRAVWFISTLLSPTYVLNMSSDQSLAPFILGGKQQAFTSYKKTQSLALNKVYRRVTMAWENECWHWDLFIQATVVTNEKDGGEFALVELTDGYHWVPAIASIPVLEAGLGYVIVVSCTYAWVL